jgi:GPH family glycoside/pentoside/hexuronide:cation symporter
MSENHARLPAALKISWGIGSIGTTSMLYLINLFLVFFLVRHVGLDAAVAGMLLAVTRLYDAIIDPAIGALSDRTESRWGRRRPWMLAGTIVCPVACIAIFNSPEGLSGAVLNAYVLGALLLYLTGYSLFTIPYTALGAEMSDDYGERASVMAYRTFFVYCAGIVTAFGAPALVAALGKDRAAYSTMSFAAAAVVGATMLCVVLFTGRARVTVRSKERLVAGAWWRTTLQNTPYLLILLTKMTLQVGTAFAGAAALFFQTYVTRQGESALALFGLVNSAVGVAAVPLWSLVLRRVERRPVFIVLLVANAVGYLSWLLADPSETQLTLALRGVLLGFAGSGSVLVAMAMLTDTMEYDRLRTGQRREGLFVGGFELVQTTSFVVGPLVTGFAFSAAGLVPGHVSAAEQPESALTMIRIAMGVIPAVSCGLGILLLLAYRLSAGELTKMRAEREAADVDAAAARSAPAPTAAQPAGAAG